MVVVDAGIDDSDDRRRRVRDRVPGLPCCEVPGRTGVDVCPGRPGDCRVLVDDDGLTGIDEAPLVAEARVVRDLVGGKQPVWLGVANAGLPFEGLDRAQHAPRRDLKEMRARANKPALARTDGRFDRALGCARSTSDEADEDVVGSEVRHTEGARLRRTCRGGAAEREEDGQSEQPNSQLR
jgi:hypothetical protein